MRTRTKRQIWLFVALLALAGVCLFMRELMREIGQDQCNANPDLRLEFETFLCANDTIEFFYKALDNLVYVFFALAVLVPLALRLRQHFAHLRTKNHRRLDRRKKYL